MARRRRRRGKGALNQMCLRSQRVPGGCTAQWGEPASGRWLDLALLLSPVVVVPIVVWLVVAP